MSSHKDYKLLQIQKHGKNFLNQSESGGLVLGFHGELIGFFVEEKIQCLKKAKKSLTRITDQKIDLDVLIQQVESNDLFGTEQFFVLKNLEKFAQKKSILEWFATHKPQNVVLSMQYSSKPKNFEKLMEMVVSVLCPKSFDFHAWVVFLDQYFGLGLPKNVLLQVEATAGENIQKSSQIMSDMRLLLEAFPDAHEQKWQTYLADKHAGKLFDLESLILAKKWQETALLLDYLLSQGVADLVVLSVFVRHFRKMIHVKSGNLQEIKFLPPHVQRNIQNFAKQYLISDFTKGLQMCQNVDNRVKKSGRGGFAKFSEILSVYRGSYNRVAR